MSKPTSSAGGGAARGSISTCQVEMVVAMTRDGVIGNNGRIPWDVPEDRKLFQEITRGGIVIMGRKTFESIGSPLPERENIVLSRSRRRLAGAQVIGSAEKALRQANGDKSIFVIGGAEVYAEFLPFTSVAHVSWIKGKFEGDAWFPKVTWKDWRLAERRKYDGFIYEKLVQ